MNPARPTNSAPDRLLGDLRRLHTGRAPEARLIDGVKRARAAGWGWTPIAIALDCTRDEAIRRVSLGVRHPCARRRARPAGTPR